MSNRSAKRYSSSGVPLISVLMSARNAALYIEDALRSLLAQDEGDFELLITDDSSDDDTGEIIHSLHDPRIIPFSNEKQLGLTSTLNRLLPLARGEFIARMDADDISLPHRFKEQVNFLRCNSDVWVCGGQFIVFNSTWEYIQTLPFEHDDIMAALLFFCPLPHPFIMSRGMEWRKHGIRYDYRMKYAQDYELWQRIKLQYPKARFANLDSVLGRYRVHPKGISQAHYQEQCQMAVRAQMQTLKAMGISSADKKIRYHRNIYQTMAAKNMEEAHHILEWAMKLKIANKKSGIFCHKSFMRNMEARLSQIIDKSYIDIGIINYLFA